jgi:hypothetical protein
LADDEYAELRRLTARRQFDLVRTKVPRGAGPMWWLAVAEEVESRILSMARGTEPEHLDDLRFGVAWLRFAVSEGAVSPGLAAAGMVRLAALAARAPSPAGLPDDVTPNGAARYALDNLPLSQPVALAVARQAQDEFAAGLAEFYQPGDDLFGPSHKPDPEVEQLRELKRVVHYLAEIVDHIEDPHLAAEVRSWLNLDDQLSETPDPAE